MSLYTLSGSESLGIEFGSTRIKAVLIDNDFNVIATGNHDWQNSLINGVWTYSLDDVWNGLRDAYAKLNDDLYSKYGERIKKLSAIGISAMMHGYLAFDKNGAQLAEFRTWRNTITYDAASKLTKLFNFNIPQRWSIAHLYQAMLNGEEHVSKIDHLTTLAGYVHWKLTGNKVLGVGEASGMFPIDSKTGDFDSNMLSEFSSLPEVCGYDLNIRDILPSVLPAGANGGTLTPQGALLLDPTGSLQSGAVLCPPEGDAGTGMVATNSVRANTGNVSAGTSIFSMVVLEKPLSGVYEQIDMVTTPTGKPVAMVHCNNCCTDLDQWVGLFCEYSALAGLDITKPKIYDLLYNAALNGDYDCGGTVSVNYFSGEPVTSFKDGRPLLVRSQDALFNLTNFMRSLVFSTMATLKIGMEILEKEGVKISKLTGHGGLFKTPVVGQKLMAGAMNTPVAVMETAGEGGAWGIAILAEYASHNCGESLEDYLDHKVFRRYKSSVIEPNECDVKGFDAYMQAYKKTLAVEKAAVENL